MPDDNTLDFTNDGGEHAVDYASWENLDNNGFVDEFNAIRHQISDCIGLLDNMVENSDCKKTEDGMMALATGPISRNSWLYTYRSHNSEAFSKYTTGEARPSWYGGLDLKQKRQYDIGLRYYKDMIRLEEGMDAIAQMIIEIVSDETIRWDYRLLKIEYNLEDKGINENFYKTVELDARQVSDRINQSAYDLSRIATTAQAFYDQYYGKMSDSEFERRYHQARLKDYLDDFRDRKLNESFGALSDGSFYVAAPVLAKSSVVDGYTNLIAQKENYGDRLRKLDARCETILKDILAPGEKASETDAGRQLFVALRQLVECIDRHAVQTDTVLSAFKGADPDHGPWCFMRTLSAYDAIKPRYALKPQKVNPWDRGTAYKDLYIMEAVALTEHCEAFVYQMGKV